MQRFFRGLLALTLILAPASQFGCGGGETVDDIQDSEEVKAADQAGQKAMEEFMKSQGKAAQ
jgi:hypothetical protein